MSRHLYRFLLIAVALASAVTMHAADTVTLANSHVTMEFSSAGQFSFISYKTDDIQVLGQGAQVDRLWSLSLLGPQGETPVFTPANARFLRAVAENDGRTVILMWSVMIDREDKWPVSVKVELPDNDSPLSEWGISAKLPEGWTVTGVEFPRIPFVSKGKAIIPEGMGAEISLLPGVTLEAAYPSSACGMQMVMLPLGGATVYYAAADRDANVKTFTVTPQGTSALISESVTASSSWTTDEGEFALPWHVTVGYCPRNWDKVAVEWYRPFALTTRWGAPVLADRHRASWLTDADVWICPEGMDSKTLDYAERAVDYFGDGTGVLWRGWSDNAMHEAYPEYFPVDDNFQRISKVLREIGGKVVPYTDPRHWDPASDTFNFLHGCDASCRRADGTLYTEVSSFTGTMHAVTCPSTPVCKTMMRQIDSILVSSVPVDGIFAGNGGGALPLPCYAQGHNHALGGGSWWGSEMREALNAIGDEVLGEDRALISDGWQECGLDSFDMMTVSMSSHDGNARIIPLMPLVYSDRAIYSGLTNYPASLNDGGALYLIMKSFLWGGQLGWLAPQVLMDQENSCEAMFMRTLAAYRDTLHDIFPGGRFMGEFTPGGENPEEDVPGFGSSPAVMGAHWQTLDGTDAWLLVNMSSRPHRVTLPDGTEVRVPAYDAERM